MQDFATIHNMNCGHPFNHDWDCFCLLIKTGQESHISMDWWPSPSQQKITNILTRGNLDLEFELFKFGFPMNYHKYSASEIGLRPWTFKSSPISNFHIWLPKKGVPPVLIQLNRMFHSKPSSYWGNPHDLGTPSDVVNKSPTGHRGCRHTAAQDKCQKGWQSTPSNPQSGICSCTSERCAKVLQ